MFLITKKSKNASLGMNKINKSKFKNSISITHYRMSQRIYQIFEILRLYCFAFTALAIDKTFTQRNFLPSKIEIVPMYFPIKI